MPDTLSTDPHAHPVTRRRFLALAASVSTVTACSRLAPRPASSAVSPARGDTTPIALVYRGRASCSGCSEAVAHLLRTGPTQFDTRYCGPDEQTPLSAGALATATVYAQPGGGSVRSAWRHLSEYADDLRAWIHNGGHYLGFCLGGYLAGAMPGYQLLPGDAQEYIKSNGAGVHDTDDTIVQVLWRGVPRHMYFQDGPLFVLTDQAASSVLATYDSGAPAAVVATFGSGRVGVVGPHPEADATWYRAAHLTNPDGIRFDLGYDLIEQTLHGRPVQTN